MVFPFKKIFQKHRLIKKTKGEFSSPSIVIKTPVSKWRRAHSWGDYHLAVLLKKELEKLGYFVLIQIFPEWENTKADHYDVAIVFRGLRRYKIKANQINIMWNISHPDAVSLEEYQEYDHVFIASDYWSKKIANQIQTPVDSMLQCTDSQRFKAPDFKAQRQYQEQYQQQLLFVGNSRKIHRKILRDLLPTDYELSVYGKEWKGIIPSKYIKARHIANNELYKYYGSANILLNDHWDDMRDKGFISNRIFDGLACGAFILSDKVRDMGELGKYVQTYETRDELHKHIHYYLTHTKKRQEIARKGMEYVQNNHTFKKRAEQFSNTIKVLIREKAKGHL